MTCAAPEACTKENFARKPCARLNKAKFALTSSILPGMADAAYNFNFPEPVTPIARETLHIHNEFMLIITVLFVAVFAIMIYSMIKHRKSIGHQPANFTGPRNALQWLWVLIPFAILLFIDFILMGIPAVEAIINMEDTKTRADMAVSYTHLTLPTSDLV